MEVDLGNYDIFLKKLVNLFDPWVEKTSTQPIWVKLLALPLEFWNGSMKKSIEDNIGVLLGIDERSRSLVMRYVARFLVKMDFREKLLENVQIEIVN
jgi:hypothetical protein